MRTEDILICHFYLVEVLYWCKDTYSSYSVNVLSIIHIYLTEIPEGAHDPDELAAAIEDGE